MKSIEYDLGYFKAGLEALEQYLLSSEVFWPLGARPPAGKPDYPQLTLDWMLLTQARLEAHRLAGKQNESIERLITEFNGKRMKWRVAWEKKAAQCFRVRGRMWSDFLQEYRENPQDNADRYSYEVRLRVMLELLHVEYRQQNAEIQLLAGLDGYIRSIFIPGEFIWEPEIKAGFPQEKYWFLYGKLPANVKQ